MIDQTKLFGGELMLPKMVLLALIASAALSGCYIAPRPQLQSDAAISDKHVGTTRWSDPKRPAEACETIKDYTKPLPACWTVPGGTALTIQRAVPGRFGTVDGYEVTDAAGKVGFITSTAPIFLLTAEEKQAADAAEVDCKRRGGVAIGMSRSQVYASCWGKPQRINTTTTAGGTREQLVYGGNYVYLDDGIVRSIQTSGR